MSYLRGPLTRQEIKRLTPSDRAVSVKPTGASKSKPGASPAAKRGRVVLPAGIDEVFSSDQPGTYRPFLVATLSLHYVRASQGLDEWEEHLLLAPLEEDRPWESLELFALDELDLGDEAPGEADFVSPPSGSVGKARFRTYAKQIKSSVYQERPRTLWRCKPLKLDSKLGETKAEFAARVQLAKREKRDKAVDKLREQFAKKVKQAEARVRRAADKVEREKSQYDQQKLQTGISMGATVLGAIFGSRGMGRATSTARGAGRIAREREDVRRAEDDLRDLTDAQRELEVEAEEEARALYADMDLEAIEIEELLVRPRKSDIAVSDFKLAWKRV
jgi:hypothetical protein